MKNLRRILAPALALALLPSALAADITADRAGNPIALPGEIARVISLAPSVTQVICDIGLGDALVAVDTQSPRYSDVPEALPRFNMMEPDIEQIFALQPDVVFTSGMSYIEGDPYAMLTKLGVCVVEIPSSESIAAVMEDVGFIADCLGKHDEGAALVDGMRDTIDAVAAKGAAIEDKKTVLFEISALPAIYSFGAGTFLDEMIGIVGAENVFADAQSWMSVAEENAVAANPDVILTNVDYIDDPVAEILARPGWDAVRAVQDGAVYYIDNAASSIPDHHITDALIEMAQAVYPEVYGE